MPSYVYKFVDTGETIEVQQAFTDDSLTEAEHPGTGRVMPVKKVFTPVGVTFKGNGFYKTDSRSSSKRSSSSSSDGSGDSPSSTSKGPSASTSAPAGDGSSASSGSSSSTPASTNSSAADSG